LKPGRGFSLVELIVGMAILGVLLAIAMPAFSNWLRNARVRTAAESVQNGLQLARAEAVRRNTTMRFQLVDTTRRQLRAEHSRPELGGQLRQPGRRLCNTALRHRRSAHHSKTQRCRRLRGHDPDGRPVGPGIQQPGAPHAGARSQRHDHRRARPASSCLADGGPIRCLQIMVTLGGQIRMCDPALAVGDAQACT
jgi:type IV fimbrial biogenesis protein FimT